MREVIGDIIGALSLFATAVALFYIGAALAPAPETITTPAEMNDETTDFD